MQLDEFFELRDQPRERNEVSVFKLAEIKSAIAQVSFSPLSFLLLLAKITSFVGYLDAPLRLCRPLFPDFRASPRMAAIPNGDYIRGIVILVARSVRQLFRHGCGTTLAGSSVARAPAVPRLIKHVLII